MGICKFIVALSRPCCRPKVAGVIIPVYINVFALALVLIASYMLTLDIECYKVIFFLFSQLISKQYSFPSQTDNWAFRERQLPVPPCGYPGASVARPGDPGQHGDAAGASSEGSEAAPALAGLVRGAVDLLSGVRIRGVLHERRGRRGGGRKGYVANADGVKDHKANVARHHCR